MYLLVCEGFEGYLKNANCFAFFKTRALGEIIFLHILARKLLEEEESLPLRELEKEVAGSPSARARQPILSAKLNFLSLFCEAKQPEAGFSIFSFWYPYANYSM